MLQAREQSARMRHAGSRHSWASCDPLAWAARALLAVVSAARICLPRSSVRPRTAVPAGLHRAPAQIASGAHCASLTDPCTHALVRPRSPAPTHQPSAKAIATHIDAYAQVPHPRSTPIRAFAWHCHRQRFAFAAADDGVRVCGCGCGALDGAAPLAPTEVRASSGPMPDAAAAAALEVRYEQLALLRCDLQTRVMAIAWRPTSGLELAVACAAGCVVWRVTPATRATAGSTSFAASSPTPDPVTTITTTTTRTATAVIAGRPVARDIRSKGGDASSARDRHWSRTRTWNHASAVLLEYAGHVPVLDVAWSPDGVLLATVSPLDTAVLVWDVAAECATPLRRVLGAGHTLARWAGFDGGRLLTASISPTLRVWDTQRWSSEAWTCAAGRVRVRAVAAARQCARRSRPLLTRRRTSRPQCACWAPRGDTLLFAVHDDALLYAMVFAQAAPSLSARAVIVADLAETPLPSCRDADAADGHDADQVDQDDEHHQYHGRGGRATAATLGGPISCMALDPTGERLAVGFVACPYVAVFRVRLQPYIELVLRCVARRRWRKHGGRMSA